MISAAIPARITTAVGHFPRLPGGRRVPRGFSFPRASLPRIAPRRRSAVEPCILPWRAGHAGCPFGLIIPITCPSSLAALPDRLYPVTIIIFLFRKRAVLARRPVGHAFFPPLFPAFIGALQSLQVNGSPPHALAAFRAWRLQLHNPNIFKRIYPDDSAQVIMDLESKIKRIIRRNCFRQGFSG